MEHISAIKTGFLACMVCIGTFISDLLGGWDTAMQTLVIFMAIDFFTGILVAVVWKKSPKSCGGALDSRSSFLGLCKKGVILLIVLIGARLDLAFSLDNIIRTAMILFFIGNEGISIIENAGLMGIRLPTKVKKMFEQLKDEGEENINKIDPEV